VRRRPEALRSQLLAGTIRHRRDRHASEDFTHRVWYLAVDLDELDEVDRRLWLLSHGRRNVLELRDADHLERGHEGLAAAMGRRLRDLDLDPAGLRVTLIAYPRVLGYVFNPVSFYLCHDLDGALRVVFAEVHNTHGDREVYAFLRAADGSPVFKGVQAKRMYVSPFIVPEAQYELQVWEDESHLAVTIRVHEGDGPALFTRLEVRRLPLTNGQLLRLIARDPVGPLKASALIFWHAALLWARGVPWQRYRRARVSTPRGQRKRSG
jgi:DUF1365 family protein